LQTGGRPHTRSGKSNDLNLLPRSLAAARFSLRMKSPHGSAQLFSMARREVPANMGCDK
jgi:hypothetical protein